MNQTNTEQIAVYSDPDCAGGTLIRRAATDFVAMLAVGVVTCTSQLQRPVALSTTEAVIMAAS